MICCIKNFFPSYQISFKVSCYNYFFLLMFTNSSIGFLRPLDLWINIAQACFNFIALHNFFLRSQQPSKWNPSSIYEGFVCGAVPHCTCQTEVTLAKQLLTYCDGRSYDNRWICPIINQPQHLWPWFFVGEAYLISYTFNQCFKNLFRQLFVNNNVKVIWFSYSFSSLLPYLPMLMDPLVSALNGSQTLVSQVLWYESCLWPGSIVFFGGVGQFFLEGGAPSLSPEKSKRWWNSGLFNNFEKVSCGIAKRQLMLSLFSSWGKEKGDDDNDKFWNSLVQKIIFCEMYTVSDFL